MLARGLHKMYTLTEQKKKETCFTVWKAIFFFNIEMYEKCDIVALEYSPPFTRFSSLRIYQPFSRTFYIFFLQETRHLIG